MTSDEDNDLADMKTKILNIKYKAIEYLLFSRKNSVTHTGYATIESLVMGTLSRCQADIDKLTKEHVMKYPDQEI